MRHEWDEWGKPTELVRRHGVTEQTLYRWKKKYGGMLVAEAKRIKALEEEYCQFKRLVAEQALNLQVVKDLLGKSSDARATADGCEHAMQIADLSERQAWSPIFAMYDGYPNTVAFYGVGFGEQGGSSGVFSKFWQIKQDLGSNLWIF